MTDEEKKKIYSEPPPPTDEIDQEWGEDGDPSKTGEAKPAVKAKASAPSEEEDESEPVDDEEEDDEEEDDGDEEEDDEEEAHVAPARTKTSSKAPPATDPIPNWAPYAVLALLVLVSIFGGLGLVGSSAPSGEDKAEGADAKPAAAEAAPKAEPHK